MTVETSASKAVFLGNGATTVFSYNFEIDFATYVVLTYTDAIGNVTTLASSVWSITGLTNPSGGTITYPLAGSPIAAGTTLTLQRVVPFTQPTNLTNQSGLWPSVVMAMDDNLEYQIQQLAETVSRAIVVSVSETGPEPPLPPPAARAGMNLTFDAFGNPTASLPATGSVAISSVMQAVVGAASIAAADTLLGISAAMQPVVGASTTAAATGLLNYQAAGTGSVARALTGKLGDLLSVKDFGATGNGTSDDTAAIQAANDAAGATGASVYFPAGTYKINVSGLLQNASWFGDGPAESIIKAGAVTFASGMINATSLNNFFLADLGFDMSAAVCPAGSGAAPGALYPIYTATTSSGWTVENCNFYGIAAQICGIEVEGGSNWSINNNSFVATSSPLWNQGINVSVNAAAVSDYTIADNMLIGTAMAVLGASGGTITGNHVSNWKFGAGITIDPSSQGLFTIISNNKCSGGAGIDSNSTNPAGIECWGAYTTISDNICFFNSGHGISIGNTGCTVSGNVCLNNGQVGGSGIAAYSIAGFAASECVITGNFCFDNQGSKTQLYGYAEYVVAGVGISGNTIADNNFNQNKTGTSLTAGDLMSWRGPRLFFTSAAAPGGIGSGAVTSNVYALVGAALGDSVTVSYAGDLLGCNLSAYVNAAGSITLQFHNITGSTQTLGSEVVNFWVEKPPGYATLP